MNSLRSAVGNAVAKVAAASAAALLLAALAACASVQPTHFHTLMPGRLPAPGAAPALDATAHWELLPVTVPAQVDQPQWVVRLPDDTLALLENERWIAPLADEIHGALAEHLHRALPALHGSATWRIAVAVQRFESLPGRDALLEAEWSLRGADGGPARLRCRGVYVQPPADPSYAALAAAHRAALARLGDALAGALRALDAGRTPACG